MTLTVTQFGFGTIVGPGTRFGIHTDLIGPVAIDDGVVVYVNSAALGGAVIFGSASFAGSHDCVVRLGRFDFGGVIDVQEQIASGAAVTVIARAYHANGVQWDTSGTTGGLTFQDSGLWYLTANARAQLDTKPILDAVIRSFPAP